jgi:hypothetical protein
MTFTAALLGGAGLIAFRFVDVESSRPSIVRCAVGRRFAADGLPMMGIGLFDLCRASGANIFETSPIASKDRLQLRHPLPS